MLWMVILPWRQRNLRECRITGSSPNLFKAPIRPFSTATKPLWIVEQERTSPGSSYWQFHFSEEETKMKHDVQAFVPLELVPLLEEYITKHRPVLVNAASDPGTLLVNQAGGPMTMHQMLSLVKTLASAYAGAPATPHLFRDIVAYAWLNAHPEDYLTISKLLWHKNINTTLQIYGRRFDESTGVARMDDWRASRSKKAA
jgi:integrase